MAVNLTRDAIALVSSGEADLKPVLQVADIRLVNTVQNTAERYRMLLSDGSHLQQAMLATQMNHVIKSGKLQKGSIVQLTEFICNLIQNRKIIIIINLEVIVEKCDPIGEPKQYVDGATSMPAPQSRSSLPALSSSMGQPGMAGGNAQPYGSSVAGGQNVGGASHLLSKAESYNASYTGGPSSGSVTSGSLLQPKSEPDTEPSGLSGNCMNQAKYVNKDNQTSSVPGAVGGPRLVSNTPYGRPAQSTNHQPPPMYSNRGPIAKNEAPARIIPIAALNPYQNRWTIKARVTSKGELRRYNNPRGEGKVFSFDLLDSDSGEIRVTCFNAVADQFYDHIEVGKVYMISKGSLKPAQKNFNPLNSEYEIFLESTSTVQPCAGEDSSIPKQHFNFRPIGDIEGMENNSTVDIIGIVSSINPSSTVMRKNGTETLKRTLQLKDMSGRSVEVTFWGNFCNAEGAQLQGMCDSGVLAVLAVKAGRVNEFSGKSLGTISSSQLFINPDFPEAHRLMDWFNREGKNTASISISRDISSIGRTDIWKTVSQIKDEGLGRSEKPDWITVKATISFIKVDNFCYTACPLMVGDRICQKKVNNNGDGTWHCERCDQTFTECDYRYLLQLQIQDHTGLTWVTAFQGCGEEIMAIPAKDLYFLKYEEQDEMKFTEIVRKVLFTQFIFKLKVKEETFSDEQRVKSTVVKAEKVNFSSESKHLLSLIDKLKVDTSVGIPGRPLDVVSEAGISAASYVGNMGTGQHTHSIGNMGTGQGTYSVGSNAGIGSFERHEISPLNQVRHYGNRHGIAGQRDQGGYLLCSSCGGAGHDSHNCPRFTGGQGLPFTGGYNNSISSSKCYKCNQSGHWAKECPGLNVTTTSYGSSGFRYGVPR